MEFTTTPPHDGAFAEYVSWPADLCYPLPERVPTVEGALCELLSVGSTRSDGGDIGPGDTDSRLSILPVVTDRRRSPHLETNKKYGIEFCYIICGIKDNFYNWLNSAFRTFLKSAPRKFSNLVS